MIRRSRARIVVLQVLVEDDLNPQRNMAQSDQFLKRRLRHFPETLEFAQSLLAGVRRERPDLDRRMAATAQNWTLQRMAVTDRNAIRLGMYEILHAGTPRAVAIDEAVELAKRFGTAHSGQFVNGVLDRFLETCPPDDETNVSATEDDSAEDDSAEDALTAIEAAASDVAAPPDAAKSLRGSGPLRGFGRSRKAKSAEPDK
jgi:N utilization substance protein B